MDLDDETRLLDTIVARRATPGAARAHIDRAAHAKEAFAEHGR
jgi:hypothetical protein